MELSSYVEGLRRELGTVTRFASDDVVEVAGQLADALDAPVRLTLLSALTAAAAEITTKLDDAVVDVRLSAGEPELVVTAVPAEAAAPRAQPDFDATADEAGTARVTLRLSDGLKTKVEAQAATEGISVNAWLTRAAIRALDQPDPPGRRGRPGAGQRITGYARS
jgi:hypothetical protein